MKRDEKRILKRVEKKLTPLYLPERTGSGHDVSHVKRMLKIAERIVRPDVDLFLLKVAIWLHNLDRAISEKEVAIFSENLLSSFEAFSREEIDLIIDAVEKHSLLNDDSDSPLLQDLKDCDRLDSGATIVMRLSAYRGEVESPLYLPGDFKENLDLSGDEKTVIKSHAQDLRRVLGWEKMLRNPRAIEFGRKRFAFLKRFLEQLRRELQELDEI